PVEPDPVRTGGGKATMTTTTNGHYPRTQHGELRPTQRWNAPLRGAHDPGSNPDATTPGSFANAPDGGGPLAFSSPDTPGMPAPPTKTAWDFLPEGWSAVRIPKGSPQGEPCRSCVGDSREV